MTSEELKNLKDDISETDALLDQAQAHFDAHKHLWTEDQAWHFQADIDAKRFHLECNKLTVNMLVRM